MNRIISNNTIVPTKLIEGDFYSMPILNDYMELKTKPEKDVLLICEKDKEQDIKQYVGEVKRNMGDKFL